MPQAGFYDKKLLLVENRNHVWRDLSRLVDVECKQYVDFNLQVCISFQVQSCEPQAGPSDFFPFFLWRTGTMCGGISPGWLMLSVKKSLVILYLTSGEEELVISTFMWMYIHT